MSIFACIRCTLFSLFAVAISLCSAQDFGSKMNNDSLFRFTPDQTMRVAVKTTPPFIIPNEDGTYSGLSIVLWEEVANRLNIDFEYVLFEDLALLLDAVENGDADIAINPLTVTPERMVRLNFTQPFFITNLAISSTPRKRDAIRRFLENLFSKDFFIAVGLLVLVILIFGGVTWLFERRHVEHEFSNTARGLWDAFWWSAVTMTTVGYGDKAPKSAGGRITALIWMFTAIIIISGFTASIASSLTVDNLRMNINSVDDLKNARVVAVKASSAESFLHLRKIPYSKVASTRKALEALANGEYEAFVYDEPIMRYEIMDLGLSDKISVAPAKFVTQYYAFAMPYKYDNALPALNLAIINIIKSNTWRAELSRYQLE